jgi:hypothetical protein
VTVGAATAIRAAELAGACGVARRPASIGSRAARTAPVLRRADDAGCPGEPGPFQEAARQQAHHSRRGVQQNPRRLCAEARAQHDAEQRQQREQPGGGPRACQLCA